MPWWIETARGYLSGLRNRRRPRKGIRVFCYHGLVERKKDLRLERNFVSLSDFRSHLHFLRRVRVLSLSELIEELTNPKRQRRPAAIITFDDGYANNLLAAEVLSVFGLPWSVFVSTGAVGNNNPIWVNEFSLLLLYGRTKKIELFGKDWPLTNRKEREVAFGATRYRMLYISSDLRKQEMARLHNQFPEGETQRLLSEFPSFQMLSWKEIKQLAGAGVEIGSHGVNHEIHHPTQTEAVRYYELIESKRVLEKELSKECGYFAFPNGNFTPSSAEQVQKSGYKIAFTTRSGTILPGVNPYLLPRLETKPLLHRLVQEFFWEVPVRAEGI